MYMDCQTSQEIGFVPRSFSHLLFNLNNHVENVESSCLYWPHGKLLGEPMMNWLSRIKNLFIRMLYKSDTFAYSALQFEYQSLPMLSIANLPNCVSTVHCESTILRLRLYLKLTKQDVTNPRTKELFCSRVAGSEALIMMEDIKQIDKPIKQLGEIESMALYRVSRPFRPKDLKGRPF